MECVSFAFGILQFLHFSQQLYVHVHTQAEREKWEKGLAYLSINHSLETAIPTGSWWKPSPLAWLAMLPRPAHGGVRGPFTDTVLASPELSSNISETAEKFYFLGWEFKSPATSLRALADFTSLQFLSINKEECQASSCCKVEKLPWVCFLSSCVWLYRPGVSWGLLVQGPDSVTVRRSLTQAWSSSWPSRSALFGD